MADSSSNPLRDPRSPDWRGAADHPREVERLAAVAETGMVGGPIDELQEAVVRLASQICGTPISAVSLVDRDRQWFSAIHGLQGRETPREVAFCAHTILAEVPLVVPDAPADQRFAWNPFVTGDPGVRFYAGVPLTCSDGLPLGSLCVIDRVPREITAEQLNGLRTLAALVGVHLESRRREHRLREEAMAKRELADRFSKIASRVPGVIYQYRLHPDGSSCFPYASDGIREIYRVTPEQVQHDASAVLELLHPDDAPYVAAATHESARTLKPWQIEYRIRFPDGVIRWLRGDSIPQREPDGSTLWHGFITDITAAKKALVELRSMTERVELANRAGGVGTWDWDVVDNKLTWDDQMYRLYGMKRENFGCAYDAWRSAVHPEDQVRCDHEIQQALRGEHSFDTQFRVTCPDGEVRSIRAIAVVHRDEAGTPVRMIGTNWDVTDDARAAKQLLRARQQAEAASRAKSAFLANMSHEIRTPLTAILGYADMLREDVNTATAPEQRLQTIDTICNAGQHLLSIINDILDLSKIEADKMTIERIETPLITLLQEVASIMRPKAIGKGVDLRVNLATPVPEHIISDPTRLRQILMNLTGNAVKFTEQGRVTITTSANDLDRHPRLVIDIEDSGLGMTTEQVTRLFQAFGQADETVTRKHGGTGLGLTICRRLAALMGGDVTLLHTELGKGSCFRLVLPLQPAPGAAMVSRLDVLRDTSPGVVATPTVRLSGRILLAEDGIDNQRLIGFHLKRAGAAVDFADNGRIAVEMLDKAASAGTPYDLLLTDMQMPEMDGYTLARTLRQRGSTLPIIALTAHAMAEDRTRCLEAGCDDYATKPIDKNSLLSTCANWLAARRNEGPHRPTATGAREAA